jgi:hypothetical protein
VFLFQHYIVPSKRDDQEFGKLIRDSNYALIAAKLTKLSNPILMKSIINALTNTNPMAATFYLSLYALTSLVSTYLEGYKQMLTAKVI